MKREASAPSDDASGMVFSSNMVFASAYAQATRRSTGFVKQPVHLSLSADRNHRLVGPLAIDVPELLEVRTVEIIELLAGIGERSVERIRLYRLADRGAQRRHD